VWPFPCYWRRMFERPRRDRARRGHAALLLSALITASGTVLAMADLPVTRALDKVPTPYRGRWQMLQADCSALPSSYPDYEIEITEQPEKCTIYRDKGVSRLRMFQGAQVTQPEGDPQTVTFSFKTEDKRSFVLEVKCAENSVIEGHARHIKEGETLLDAAIRLVERAATPH
jgi:hypothetical protein